MNRKYKSMDRRTITEEELVRYKRDAYFTMEREHHWECSKCGGLANYSHGDVFANPVHCDEQMVLK